MGEYASTGGCLRQRFGVRVGFDRTSCRTPLAQASEAEAEGPAAAAQFSVFWLTFVYAVDALLAASPMHW